MKMVFGKGTASAVPLGLQIMRALAPEGVALTFAFTVRPQIASSDYH